MKKELIIGICLLAVIFAVMVYLASDQQRMAAGKENINLGQPSPTHTSESSDIAGRISHNLALNSSLSMVMDVKKIEKIMVYKTLPPIVNQESTSILSKKFNVTGNFIGDQGVQSEDFRYLV